MPLRFRRLSLASASVCLVMLVLAACGSASPPEAAPASPGFVGYRWSVVAIGHDDKETPIPARYSVYLQFTPSGQFGANDPVNYHSGSYRPTADGFTTSGIATTLVGYAGNDPVTLLAIAAISSFGTHPRATVRSLTGGRIAVTVNGYTLIGQRDGTQPDFPPAKPT